MMTSNRPSKRSPRPLFSALIALPALGISACSSDDDGGRSSNFSGIGTENVSTYYAARDGAGLDTVYRSDDRFENGSSFRSGQNLGMALDYDGALYQVGATGNGPGIRVINRARDRQSGGAFASARDREIAGIETTLVDPRDITIARRQGLGIVSDAGDASIKVFSTNASGNVPPLGRTNLGGQPASASYDELEDRLFVARDQGRIDVFDNYVASGFYQSSGIAVPTRTMRINRRVGEVDPSEIGGLEYDAAEDQLWLTDVGIEGTDPDGAVHRINQASLREGDIDADYTIAGNSTDLKDPRGIEVIAGRVRVADSGANRMLQYDVETGSIGEDDRAPFASVEALDARAVVTEPNTRTYWPMPSDIDDPSTELGGMTVGAMPGIDPATDNQITRFDSQFGIGSPFDASNQPGDVVCSFAYDGAGDGYLGYENPAQGTGGVMTVSRVGNYRRSAGVDDSFSTGYDRVVAGPATGLTSPRGIDIDDASGSVVVADHGSQTIRVFDKGATGNVTPRFVANLDTPPNGIDYDGTNDRLYVGGSNGCICVFDQFLQTSPTAPSRQFGFNNGLAGGPQASVNISSVRYDETGDRVVATDVGAPGSTGSGVVYGYEGASAANGVVTPSVQAGVPQGSSQFGPTGVEFNGSSAFIADPASGSVYEYGSFFGGQQNPQPSNSIQSPSAGMIAFNPATTNSGLGGSYR